MAQQAVTKRQHIRKSRSDLAFYITINAILAILSLIIFYPLLYIVSSSFSSGAAITAGHVAEHVAPLLIHAQPARRKVNGLILKMDKHGLYEIRVGIVGAMHRFAYAHDICRYSTAGQFFLLHAYSPLEA